MAAPAEPGPHLIVTGERVAFGPLREDLIPVSIIGVKALPHNSVLPLEWMDKSTGRVVNCGSPVAPSRSFTTT